MTIFDQEIVARTAVGEARGDGDIAMQAVMWTILNRFTAKRWFSGQSLAGTALKKMQYDCWMPSDPNYALITNIEANVSLFASALLWADSVMKGMIPDPTLGATHYANLNTCAPSWLAGATQTIVIGHQTFFKNVA